MSERDPAEEIEALRAALLAERRKAAAFTELSHELRTLITGVIGLSTLLLETDLTPEQRDYVKRMRGFSDALVSLVNNVLDFSRIEAGKLELDRVDLDLRRIADEVGELCADRARARGVELCVCVSNDVPPLRGDPTRLRQVLMNLVSNALKFTDRGEVVLRASLASLSEGSALIRVEVRDTGLGISADAQARLFVPFSQVHSGDGAAGSGLGLSLSKDLVEAMGGSIGVASEPGHGSTFHFTVRLETRPAGADKSAIPRVDMAGRRALAAVPNAESRACLVEMVRPLGLALHEAATGEAAITTLRAHGRGAFDVILLDASLPGTADLMRFLDGDEALGAVPVVLLAYPGQRLDDGMPEPRSPITLGGSARLSSGRRTGSRASTRVVAGLAKPIRQAHLHACLFTLMGSAMETVSPDSRRQGPSSRRTLPRQAIMAAEPEPKPPVTTGPPPSTRPADRPRVLLVEDNAVNQRVAKLMMEKRGYQVDVAADGHEAVEATLRTPYAAVLMDCHMPRLDGYSATQEIRRRDAHKPRLPIIAMTANAGPGARERCLSAGMDDYVAKPVSAESIDEVLRRWVSRAPPLAPAPTRRSTPPPIDLGMLRKLRASQAEGEPDIVTEVVAIFLQDAPARVAAIREAVARGDLAGASRTAHTLKGSAGHLGAKNLAALCARFEEKVRDGAAFNVTFAASAIADELERVRVALSDQVPTNPKP